jgi:O-antigen/teichoic acid export membrane protein
VAAGSRGGAAKGVSRKGTDTLPAVRATDRLRRFVHSGSSMAVSISIANVGTYGFTVLAARILGPHQYGAVAALMATVLVTSVLPLGLQATGARRVSAEPEHRAEIEREVLRVGWISALGLGVVLLLAAPALERLLKLDSLVPALLVAATSIPLTLMGAQSGVLQGERRWAPLSLIYLALGIPRLVIGVAFIAWEPTQTAAMAGITIAAICPAVVGWLALRHRPRPADESPVDGEAERRHPTTDILRETAHNSQALLAFFALSNADIIVARHALDNHQAGIYASGLILTKAMLFLPQFVVVVAFPDMSTAEGRRPALLRSLGLVAILGVLGIAGVLLLPRLALAFVGGSAYAQVSDQLWLFAVLGTVLSMLQLLVYAVLARSGRRPVLFVWLAFCLLFVGGLQAMTVTGLLATVLTVDSLLLLALLLTDVLRPRQLAPADTDLPRPTPTT